MRASMRTRLATVAFRGCRLAGSSLKKLWTLSALLTLGAATALAQPASEAAGGEANRR